MLKQYNMPTRRAVLGGLLASAARPQPSDKPFNVVLLIADQMRGDALGFLGSPNARTPNLDRLAGQGVSFDNYFVNNPVCLPSRKSIFSGLYPHQHGSLTNRDGKPMEIAGSMVEHFKKRGYRVGYMGKNHTFRDSALESAADTAHIRDREPFRAYNRYVPPEWHSDTYWPAEKCYAWQSTDEALQFIDGARDGNPFFLTVSYFDPHPPYMAPSGVYEPLPFGSDENSAVYCAVTTERASRRLLPRHEIRQNQRLRPHRNDALLFRSHRRNGRSPGGTHHVGAFQQGSG